MNEQRENLKKHLQEYLLTPIPKGSQEMVCVIDRPQAQDILEMIRGEEERESAKKNG